MRFVALNNNFIEGPPFSTRRHNIDNICIVIINVGVRIVVIGNIQIELIEVVVIVVDIVVYIHH